MTTLMTSTPTAEAHQVQDCTQELTSLSILHGIVGFWSVGQIPGNGAMKPAGGGMVCIGWVNDGWMVANGGR